MKKVLYVQSDPYEYLELFFCSDLSYNSGHAPTQNMLIINNNSSRMTQNLLAVLSDLSYSTPLRPPFCYHRGVWKRWTNVQQQDALSQLEIHTLLPHGNDYTTLVVSHVSQHRLAEIKCLFMRVFMTCLAIARSIMFTHVHNTCL